MNTYTDSEEPMPWNISNGVWEEPQVERENMERRLREWGIGRELPRSLAGPPIASRNQPIHRPHYTDTRFQGGKEHTLFGAGEKDLSYEYSDRLWQWDWDKAHASAEEANNTESNDTPAWYEAYLSAYFGKPVALRHIIGGVNVGNGYEYYVFGFKDRES